MATRITSKGQITLPKLVRDALGLKPGDAIEFVYGERDFSIRKVMQPSPISRYRGHLTALAGTTPDAIITELRGD